MSYSKEFDEMTIEELEQTNLYYRSTRYIAGIDEYLKLAKDRIALLPVSQARLDAEAELRELVAIYHEAESQIDSIEAANAVARTIIGHVEDRIYDTRIPLTDETESYLKNRDGTLNWSV